MEVIDLGKGDDVLTLKYRDLSVRGILAAPPCTDLAGSGARWWTDKGDAALTDALAVAEPKSNALVMLRNLQSDHLQRLIPPVDVISIALLAETIRTFEKCASSELAAPPIRKQTPAPT